jgi:hypothetical protein
LDFVHAWRNRAAIRTADVVWTHSESHGLGVAAVHALTRAGRRPAMLLQNVWLIDRWRRYPPPHRWLFTRLLRRADVLTFLSSQNRDIAASLFPGNRCVTVLYGIRAEDKRLPRRPVTLDGRGTRWCQFRSNATAPTASNHIPITGTSRT